MTASPSTAPGNQLAPGGRSMEVTAWAVLLGALALFALGLVGVPMLLLEFARSATIPEAALVESKTGSVMLESSVPITMVLASGQSMPEAPEGITVTTYPDANAFIRMFDDSVVHLRPGTAVGLRRMRQPRFGAGGAGRRIRLYARPANGGPAVLSVGTTAGDVLFEVDTPHGEVVVGPDAQARIEITANGLSVRGGEGQTKVSAAGQTVTLGYDQRTTVAAGQAPSAPSTAEENVVQDPGFDAPVAPDGESPWQRIYDPETAASHSAPVRLPDGRSVLRFERRDSNGRQGDIYYRQTMNTDVADATYLGLSANLRIIAQELAGGGIRATEFPVILSLIYRDENNTEDLRWETGFYAKPLAADDTTSTALDANRTQLVALGDWEAYDSGNLLEPANPRGFAALGLPRPTRLVRIEVKASGHDLTSEVDDVGVWRK